MLKSTFARGERLVGAGPADPPGSVSGLRAEPLSIGLRFSPIRHNLGKEI